MILTVDVGNSCFYCGVFDDGNIKLRFRKISKGDGFSSDELGIFFRSTLNENKIMPKEITGIAICSVVPALTYSLVRACQKYFEVTPFILKAGVKTGLKISYHNPHEVGADRIANAVAAVSRYPKRDLIIVDLGTATTFCAVNTKKEYLGGAIIPGLKISVDALEKNTAKLTSVEIVRATQALGRTTSESIQGGVYYSHLGAIKEITHRLTRECFSKAQPIIIGTGGCAYLFEEEKVFNEIQPDLVLLGLHDVYQMNFHTA